MMPNDKDICNLKPNWNIAQIELKSDRFPFLKSTYRDNERR